MSSSRVLLDASVLYPAAIRDILMQLAVSNLFQAKWTADIHSEWIYSLLHDRPDINPKDLQRTRMLMNTAVRDCLITGYQHLTASLWLPDPDDRHVLAAAIVGHCNVIINQNLKDFYGINTAVLPQRFHVSPSDFLGILEKVRSLLIDWIVKLEKSGVRGDGSVFNDNEIKKASHITMTIENFYGIIGDVSHSQVNVYDYSSIFKIVKES
jgi:hypothetical protein